MKYQEELLSVFMYIGYTASLMMLIVLLLLIGIFIYNMIMSWPYVYAKIYNRALDKRLSKVSDESLERWFTDIRKRHQELKEETK